MKKLLMLLLAAVWSPAAFAQGTVLFANMAPGFQSPIHFSDGTTPVGSDFTAELLAGPALNNMNSVCTANFNLGYFYGGNVVISNVAPGTAAWCVVQFWQTQLGSFSNAYAASQADACGASAPFQVVLGGGGIPPSPPAILSRLSGAFTGHIAIGEEPVPGLGLHLSNTNAISLTWGGFPNMDWRYLLQQSSDLNPDNWVTVTNAPDFDGSTLRVTVQPPKGPVFYRLVRKLY